MKSFVLFLAVLASVAVSVLGQNPLVLAYENAMMLRASYERDLQYYRTYASFEGQEMGELYTDLVADGLAEATTADQGEGIRQCAATRARESQFNLNFMDRFITATTEAADELHLTTIRLLSTFNIKTADPDVFYYEHSYLMELAYTDLMDFYTNMYFSWVFVFSDFYYAYEELFYCIYDVLYV